MSRSASRVLVVGGAGYLGRSLARALAQRGDTVRIFDARRPPAGAFDGLDVEVVVGDLTDRAAVRAAVTGMDGVLHCASAITTLTFARAAVRARVQRVNVEGTRNVVTACLEAGVRRLVYTSSINVVQMPSAGVDESFATVGPFADLYGRSKAAAERLVLGADGRGVLHTCAIRPGGIYGPGEEQHFPRFVRELKAGKMVVYLGNGESRADNIYIDDLVDAHLRALDRLAEGSPVNGRAYFVTDGAPLHYFEFFKPAVLALGHRMPKVALPGPVLISAAAVFEAVHALGGPAPFTTVMEARKIVQDNWYSIEAARRDLGFTPTVDHAEGMRRCMPYLKALYAQA